MASFAVKFLGCKVSQADAMLARSALVAAGHIEVPEAEADLHVVNTCCITSAAQSKSRQLVRRSLRSARQVHVAGCAVNLDPRQFGDIDDRVRPFVGTADEVATAIGGGVTWVDFEPDVLARAGAGAGAGAVCAHIGRDRRRRDHPRARVPLLAASGHRGRGARGSRAGAREAAPLPGAARAGQRSVPGCIAVPARAAPSGS